MTYDTLSLDGKRRIDRVCLDYEDSRFGDSPPALSEFVERFEPEDREAGLLELIALDYELRVRNQETPTVDFYRQQLPGEASLVEAIFFQVQQELLQSNATTGSEQSLVPTLPQFLGDFRIVREIGRGGMGQVYEAVQESLQRRVALKVLPPTAWLRDRGIDRFQREARAIARLHHSHIVDVFGSGTASGVAYIAMQLVDGPGLDRVIEKCRSQIAQQAASNTAIANTASETAINHLEGSTDADSQPRVGATVSLPLHDINVDPAWHEARSRALLAARIGCEIGNALQYAHSAGVLHRDVKPSNILLDQQGTAWLTDFGLAKLLAGDHAGTLTEQGDLVGTLRYMAPESFRGQVDARGDVFGLGLALLEVITLKPAFETIEREALLAKRLRGDAPTIDTIDSSVPRDLVTVIRKAIEVDPAARYQTAGDFAADLDRVLNDEPITARRISSFERFSRWARRNPLIAVLLMTTFVLLSGGLVAALIAARHFQMLEGEQRLLVNEKSRLIDEKSRLADEKSALAIHNADLAENNGKLASTAKAERDRATLLLADAFGRQGLAAAEEGRDREALLLFAQAAGVAHGVSTEEYRFNVQRSAALSREMGRLDASGSIAGIPPHRFDMHRNKSDALIRDRFTSHMRLLATEGRELKLQDWPSSIKDATGAAWSADGSRVFVCSASNVMTLSYPQLEVAPLIANAFGADRRLNHVATDASGRWLAVTSGPDLRIWNLRERQFVTAPIAHAKPIFDLVFSSNGEWLVVVDDAHEFRLYATKGLRVESSDSVPQPTCVGRHHNIRGLSFVSPVFARQDSVLLTEREPHQLEVRELSAVDQPVLISHPIGAATVFEPIGSDQVFVAGTEGGLLLEVPAGKPPVMSQQKQLNKSIMSAAYLSERRELFIGYASRESERWAIPSWRRLPSFHVAGSGVHVAARSPDGSRLLTVDPGELRARIWSFPDSQRAPLQMAIGSRDPIMVDYSKDSKYLVAANFRGHRVVIDLSTRQRVDALGLEMGDDNLKTLGMYCVPGHQRVVTSSMVANRVNAVRVWDWSDGSLVHEQLITIPDGTRILPRGHSSRDGSRILLPFEDAPLAILVNVRDGTSVAQLLQSQESGKWLGISPDGEWLGFTNNVGQTRLIPTAQATQPPATRVWQHHLNINSLAFSRDGQLAATCSHDRFVTVVKTSDAQAFERGKLDPLWSFEQPAIVYFAVFSDDSNYLLTVCKDVKVRVWNLKTGQLEGAPMNGEEDISACFRPGRRELLTADFRGQLNVWDWRREKRVWPAQFDSRRGGSYWSNERSLTPSPDGRFIAVTAPGELLLTDLTPLDETESVTPDALLLRAEVLSGLRQQESGSTVSLTPNEWRDRAERLHSK